MSYTHHFLHDVFISYASANNARPDKERDGLITAFHERLVTQLHGLGVKEGLEIFFDAGDVGDAKPLPDQILSAARASAVFIAFHSPAYDASSDWCHREFHEFREANEDWDGRLFLISLNKDSPPVKGAVFHGLSRRARPLYEEREQRWFVFNTLRPDAKNPRGLTFHDEVEDLARELAPILRSLREKAPVKRVFLTCPSDLWKPQAQDIKNELTGLGCQVLQTSPWIGMEQRKADADRFVALADVVIGIEESFSGAEAEEARTHTAEQLEIAARLGKPQLRWLPGDDKHGFSAEQVMALKAKREIVAVSLQEFKKLVVARLNAPTAPLKLGTPPEKMALEARPGAGAGAEEGRAESDDAPPAMVLFVYAEEDEEKAFASLVTALNDWEVGYDGYVDSNSTEADAVKAWCDRLKERVTLFEPSAVMFLDGRCSRDWIDDRLRRYFVLQRDLPNRPAAAVCECEPIPKDALRRFRPTGRVQIFRDNDTDALREFLKR